MGNFFKNAIKILSLAAKALIVSLAAPQQPATPAQPVAVKPAPAFIELTQPCLTDDPNTICFETEHGTVMIFRNSSVVMP